MKKIRVKQKAYNHIRQRRNSVGKRTGEIIKSPVKPTKTVFIQWYEKGERIVNYRMDATKTRKEINRLNKQRGKAMETKVSIIFMGNTRGKVAFSGAGSEKGDNKIPLPWNSGNLYVECKTSEYEHDTYGHGLPVRYEWFDTIIKNARAMGSRFGVLALHFHGKRGYYIAFNETDIPIIESIGGQGKLTFRGPITDKRYNKSGKAQKLSTIWRNDIIKGFQITSTDSVPNARYETFNGRYVIVTIEDFRYLLGFPETFE